MYEDEFRTRLTELRVKKGVSARDMSLSLGQNAGYINNIENGKAFPSMSIFFYICYFLEISPKDFFNYSSEEPKLCADLIAKLETLDEEYLRSLSHIIDGLAAANKSKQ